MFRQWTVGRRRLVDPFVRLKLQEDIRSNLRSRPFEFLKYYSPMNTHGKTFVYDFCVLAITLSICGLKSRVLKLTFLT